jgi:hypothetical protein
MTRVAVLRDTATTAGQCQVGAIQAVAPSFGVEVTPIDVAPNFYPAAIGV